MRVTSSRAVRIAFPGHGSPVHHRGRQQRCPPLDLEQDGPQLLQQWPLVRWNQALHRLSPAEGRRDGRLRMPERSCHVRARAYSARFVSERARIEGMQPAESLAEQAKLAGVGPQRRPGHVGGREGGPYPGQADEVAAVGADHAWRRVSAVLQPAQGSGTPAQPVRCGHCPAPELPGQGHVRAERPYHEA